MVSIIACSRRSWLVPIAYTRQIRHLVNVKSNHDVSAADAEIAPVDTSGKPEGSTRRKKEEKSSH